MLYLGAEKDGYPVEHFLTFPEMKNHTGEEMANQALQSSKCWVQSYDNTANMPGRYKGVRFFKYKKKVSYLSADYSLNQVGRSAVDRCQEAGNLLQILQNFHRVSQVLRNEDVDLQSCVNLCVIS